MLLLLILAYLRGAATSLALALLVGGRVVAVMKRSLGAGELVRRTLDVLVLAGVAAIALGVDTHLLTRVSLASTGGIGQKLIDAIHLVGSVRAAARATGALPEEGELSSLTGVTRWLNSPPLAAQSLRSKVMLVDFWTYSCINCIRALPYVRGWAGKYKDRGLVAIGVHAPVFAFGKEPKNVTRAVTDLGVDCPAALDNDYAMRKAFGNEHWPTP